MCDEADYAIEAQLREQHEQEVTHALANGADSAYFAIDEESERVGSRADRAKRGPRCCNSLSESK